MHCPARALLEWIVAVARAIFAVKASSIMLFDKRAGELVFETVAGEGSDRPATQGIAGWVVASGEPIVLEDVGADPASRARSPSARATSPGG